MRIKKARQLTAGEVAAIHEGAILDYPYVETEDDAFFEVTEEQARAASQAIAHRERVWVRGHDVITVRNKPG
ncbi:hypothetical protein [Litchfieldella rifensis]|uniref:Uncharacterized protein n=1 Tax=Litchfieldella rifensis TaxID=762643 RepID=A0ABV7LMV6_9GAMM